jgi:RNA-binding protein
MFHKGGKMAALKGAVRTYLRGLAHNLRPVAQLGKSGMTERFIEGVNQALDAHELIKVKFNSFKEEKKTLAKEIEEKTQSEMVGMVGNIAIFYREHHNEEKRKIRFPEGMR